MKFVATKTAARSIRPWPSCWNAASRAAGIIDDRHFEHATPLKLPSALNNAVILQFLEQGFHSGLYHHDRWDGKYHAP